MSKFRVSSSRFIPVPAQSLFDIVADPRQHPRIDGSGSVKSADVNGPTKLHLGSTFGIGMKFGKSYTMTNTVTEYEEGRLITWKPQGDYTWSYAFMPVDGGTIVTETWDASTSTRRFMMGLLGFPKRNQRGITQTLQRLHDLALEAHDDADRQSTSTS